MILGVDPGRSKTGWAFCEDSGVLILSGITPTDEMSSFVSTLKARDLAGLERWVAEGKSSRLVLSSSLRVILGEGTGSRAVSAVFAAKGFRPESADESYSTLRARQLFWKLHPPRGWRRWFPLSLQVPTRDVDDLAAWSMVLALLETEG